MIKISEHDIELVKNSAMFDENWYRQHYQDVVIGGFDPAFHFLWLGWRLGRQPSEQVQFHFRLDDYLKTNPEIERSGIHPVAHFLAFSDPGRPTFANPTSSSSTAGEPAVQPLAQTSLTLPSPRAPEDLQIETDLVDRSPLFDPQWYTDRYPEAALEGLGPLQHFMLNGANGYDPSPCFSSAWYLKNWSDVGAANCNPLAHYLRYGMAEGRSPHPVFDADWYRRRYLAEAPDVEPLTHYLTIGHGLGLRAYPLFDAADYLDRYPDLRGAGIDPYIHWIKYGRAEGRLGINSAKLGQGLRVAVVAHIFYEDLWPQISLRLQAMPVPFDLIVTVSPGSQLADTVLAEWPDAEVITTPNAGRDIGPFLHVLPLLLERGHDVMCKLHTKRGATEPDTWRHMLLEGVLGSAVQVRQILGWFQHDPDLATVGPNDLYLNGPRFIGPNADALEDLLKRLEGPDAVVPEQWGFFAGSMFWIRTGLLRGLVDANLLPLLDQSNRSHDGQIAHAVERLFGLLAAARGGRVGLTDVSGARATTTVEVLPAPGRTVSSELAETLPVKTRELALRIPALRRAKRRAWLAPQDANLGITFLGPVEAINGLGVSARGFVDAAIATGLPVHVIKWRPGFDRVGMREIEVPTPGEQVINIIHLNLDLLYSAKLLDGPPFDQLMSPRHYNIVIVWWELLALNPDWIETIHRFDEVWVATSYIARAMQSVSAVPVRVVRPALNVFPSQTSAAIPFDLPQDRIVFLYCTDFGSIVRRKNPEAFWRAYAAEFAPEDGAFCVIKILYGEADHPLMLEIRALAESRPDILVVTDAMSDSEMEALFARIDCYVSPHRAEGLGLTLLEAMVAGKPVIATGFSGEGDFVQNDTALTVDYDLIEVGEGAEPYMAGAIWADPRQASLRRRMRQVVEDRETARTIGERGRARAIELYSLENASARMKQELTRIWRDGGGLIEGVGTQA